MKSTHTKMKYPLSQVILSSFFELFLRKVDGKENIPKKGGFIVAANHCSYMDHLLLSWIFIPCTKKKLRFLAKKEHFDTKFKKAWHNWTGAIPIDRQAGGREALKEAVNALKKGDVIAIHPEGTRSLTGKLQKGKTGVARLALAAKVPVVPVGIIGTFEILPKGKLIPKPKRAEVYIGKPVYFDKYYRKGENKKALRTVTDSVMNEIAKLAKQRYNF